MLRTNIKSLKLLLIIVFFISEYSYSQVTITQPAGVETYTIRKEAVTNPSTIVTLTNAEKTRSISYIDGFGRPLQSIVAAGSPNGKDIVSFAKYDQYGRQAKQYLPFEATTSTGAYNAMSTIEADQINFYNPLTAASKKIAIDNGPYYAESSFEPSPLGRVLKSGGLGEGFQLGLGDHNKTMSYRTGLASDNVRKWVLNTGSAGSTAMYGDYDLTVTEVTDESNVHASVYKDKFGRLILKRQDAPVSGYYDTYYVYDDIGNIIFIVPPKVIAKMYVANNYNTSLTPELTYQFWYDGKNRINRKKVPGATEVYMVYDPLDRVVLTQDGNMRNTSPKKWAYVKYDNANRVIIQGIYSNNNTLAQMQTDVNNELCYATNSTTYYEIRQSGTSGYSNQCFPQTGTEERAYNYFDDYDFNFDGNPDYSKQDQGLTGEATATNLTYGLSTGSKRKILGSGTPGTWLINISFYDKYYHVVQVRSNNQIKTGVTDHTTNVVNFAGQAKEAKQVKTIGDPNGMTNTLAITVSTRYEYDDMGRLTKVKQTNPGASELTVAKYEYNALGQLVDKKLHSTNGINYLQSVDMRYNIRGQLTSINNSGLTNDGVMNDDDNDVFGMELLYDKPDNSLGNTPNYSGMLSAVKWKANGTGVNADERSYKYSYDKLYRLTASQYQAKASNNTWTKDLNGFNESMSYDENGNIMSLQRNAVLNNVVTQIDALTYYYKSGGNSNQLEKIDDGISNNTTGYGFRNFAAAASNAAYVYDDDLTEGNGNLIADPKKGTTITYNELNKPVTITRSTLWGSQVIEYTYDASGNRISKHVTGGTVITTYKEIEYIGGYVIENGVLSYYSMAEGRVRNESGSSSLSMKMEYFITDQQGNTRVSFEDDGTNTGHAILTQENSYYAFGMQMAGSYTPTNPNKKLYNAGSEWQDDEEGLADYYSTFYREYDPIIGRFNGVDPMAEATDNMTTYAYANNNPVMMNDPMGDFAAGGPSGSIFKTGPDGERHIGWAAELMWNQLGFSDMEDNDSGGGGGGGFSNGGSGVYTNWAGQTSTEYLAAMQSGYKVKYDKDTREYGYKVYSFENGLGSAANGNTLRGVESSAKWVPFPNFATLLSNYPLPYWKRPDRTPNKDKGYTQVDDANGNSFDHFNQCAIRMSICLIKSGVNISGAKNITNPGGTTYGNGNVLGAINLGNHLKINILGKPTFTKDGTKDDVFSLISGKTGIIYFQNIVEDGTRAWGNAHIDLWDKDHYQGTDEMGRPYPFDQMLDAKIIWFWEIK